ncbi:MAG: DUF4365 domain-containing protein [Leptolyngbyaceae cyanobacterium bins.302]|nr:DUF4365 domain-containing protein [Leptolyngbyaceae cyanobacterium bins.302]
MTNLPQFSSRQRRGEKGVWIVNGIIRDQLGWIFVKLPQEYDLGIDAYIEVLTSGVQGTDEAQGTGRLIAAQIKCGSSWLDEQTADGYIFRGELKHLDYYLNYSLPVLIILCDPDSEVCWWVKVSPTSVERTRKAWRIRVPFEQRLDNTCVDQLVGISREGQNGHDAFFWWAPYEITWHHNITLVVLPVYPENGKALCISKHPITNAQYKEFVDEQWVKEPSGERYLGKEILGNHWAGSFYPWRDDDFRDPNKPVVCISYWNASLFCDWLHEKYGCYVKLPTAKLWDFAAFGTEFPTYNPNSLLKFTQKVHHQSSSPAAIDVIGERTNQWGITDLIGNIWEWCALDDEGFVGERISHDIVRHRYEGFYDRNLQLKGGSFLDDLAFTTPWMRSTELAQGSRTCHADIGFRVTTELLVSSLPTEIQEKLQLCKRLLPRTQSYRNPTLYPSDFKEKDFPT